MSYLDAFDKDFPALPQIEPRVPIKESEDPYELYPGDVRPQLQQPPRTLLLPAGVSYLVDTREQNPYLLHPAEIVTLKTGDYSITGLEERVVVERKSLPDILGCIGQSRERFERELERLSAFEYPCIVVESHLRDIRHGSYSHSRVHPNAVIGSLIAWSIRYGVHVWPTRDRREGQLVTQWILAKAWHEKAKHDKAAGGGPSGS